MSLLTQPTRRQAQIGLSQLSWLEAGSAPETLVLLHGIGSNAESWAAQLSAFATAYRVIAWDAPGYAKSQPLQGTKTSPTDYARRLKAFLDYNHITSCRLVGHSLGALIAARLALLWPECVDTLILSSPASGYGWQCGEPLLGTLQSRLDDILKLGPQGMAQSRAARTLTPNAKPECLAKAQTAMASVTVEGYKDAVHLLAQGTLKQDLLNLAIPFSVLCGTEDKTTPLSKVEPDTNVAQRQHLALLEGAAHASYLEFPALYNKTLLALLNK